MFLEKYIIIKDMESIIPTNEYTEVEGRVYTNPQIGIDETNTFIDNLRATQGQQNQEIAQQTQNLGTNVPTNLGGLTGADSYFTSRYQVPQTISNIANLRATAQAAALNDVLANEQAIWKKRYQDAYKAYQKRNHSKTYGSSSGGGSSGTTTNNNTPSADVNQSDTTIEITDIQTEGLAKSMYMSMNHLLELPDIIPTSTAIHNMNMTLMAV